MSHYTATVKPSVCLCDAWNVYKLPLLPVAGDDELSSPSQDASGLEEVMEQLNNSFPHSQGTPAALFTPTLLVKIRVQNTQTIISALFLPIRMKSFVLNVSSKGKLPSRHKCG